VVVLCLLKVTQTPTFDSATDQTLYCLLLLYSLRSWRALCSAGGFLQTVLYGYPGMRLRANGLFVKPQLPPDVRQINLVGVGYLGNKINISYDSTAVIITLQVDAQVFIAGRLLVTHGLQVVP
jgi:hypothetical protein